MWNVQLAVISLWKIIVRFQAFPTALIIVYNCLLVAKNVDPRLIEAASWTTKRVTRLWSEIIISYSLYIRTPSDFLSLFPLTVIMKISVWLFVIHFFIVFSLSLSFFFTCLGRIACNMAAGELNGIARNACRRSYHNISIVYSSFFSFFRVNMPAISLYALCRSLSVRFTIRRIAEFSLSRFFFSFLRE